MENPFLFPNPPSSSTLNNNSNNNFPPSSTSDDDDPRHPSATSPSASGAAKPSPWHRMKWTDDIVRLLINLVSFVGDDVSPTDPSPSSSSSKLQKKGKWKTVSKLMLDNGCYVSPQQCEDKFNDLNKRYKRLNEILGRGTTCQVVENPTLLDSMPHVPPKAKDDVRKILSSKHLFYREMCAYHNGQKIPNNPMDLPKLKANGVADADADAPHEDDEHEIHNDLEESDEESDEEQDVGFQKLGFESLGVEIDGLSMVQKRDWLRKRALRLLEERMEIETEGFELGKRRAKWERFKRKKDWEMERARIENEKSRIENERMVLQVRKKEMELDAEHGRF